jgi:probable rRNA maturation factor
MFTIEAYNTTSIARVPLAKMRRAVHNVLEGEGITEATVNIVVVDDVSIHEMNKTYLQHDYPTDVITFSLDEEGLSGEIYISAETAREQAKEYGVSFTNELMRLAAHGALHLAGYDDASDEERARMRQLEDTYIGVSRS